MLQYYKNKLFRFLRLISKDKYSRKTAKYTKEYKTIARSKYFDKSWYLKQNPDLLKAKADPVHHYLKYGWKEGRNPSTKFDTNAYLNANLDVKKAKMNPLYHYEQYGKKENRKLKNVAGKKEDRKLENVAGKKESIKSNLLQTDNIKKYWESYTYKEKVIYTCIAGAYDKLINHTFVNNEYDYICFSDNQSLIDQKRQGVWQVYPLMFNNMDNTRNNRWHKLHPHLIFPCYKESIYIDGNINLLTDKIFKDLKNQDLPLILPKHFKTNCIYDELGYVVECKKDSFENMVHAYNFYKKEGMPYSLGFSENNFIYRKHNDKHIINIMTTWWDMLCTYSKRDQISLAYAVWKNNDNLKKYVKLENLRLDKNNFSLSLHNKVSPKTIPSLDIVEQKRLINESKVVSFNIFDTLLVRPYINHLDLFLHLEKLENLNGFKKERVYAERRARDEIKNSEGVSLSLIYSYMDKKFAYMMQKELDLEEKTIYLNPLSFDLLEYAKSKNKTIIVSSDTYMPKDFLLKLFSKNGILGISKLYISSEIGKAKKTSNMYRYILDDMKLNPSDLLHMGDDIYEDVKIPDYMEIKTIHLDKKLNKGAYVNPNLILLNDRISEHSDVRKNIDKFTSICVNSLDLNKLISNGNYKIKIAIFTFKDSNTGSSRIRAFNLIESLKKHNIDVIVNNKDINDCNAIIYQKTSLNLINELDPIVKDRNIKTFFDIDDYFDSYNECIKKCDFVITSTNALKEILMHFNSNIVVLPNSLDIDDEYIELKPPVINIENIVWFGGIHNSYILKKLGLEHVKTISNGGDIEYDKATIDENLKNFDLVVIPQEKNKHTLCKTHCRMLKSIYLGLPCLVSDMPEYVKLANLINYPKEFIVKDGEDWNERIMQIKTGVLNFNFDFIKARKIISAHFSKEKIAIDLIDTIHREL